MRGDLNEKVKESALEVHEGMCEVEVQLDYMQVGKDEQEAVLSRAELKAGMKEAHLKSVREKDDKENAYYKARVSSILEKIAGEMLRTPEMTLAFTQVMRQDEWEYRPGKLRLNGSEGTSCKNMRKD